MNTEIAKEKKNVIILYRISVLSNIVFACLFLFYTFPGTKPSADREIINSLLFLALLGGVIAFVLHFIAHKSKEITTNKIEGKNSQVSQFVSQMPGLGQSPIVRYKNLCTFSWIVTANIGMLAVITPFLGGTFLDGMLIIIASSLLGFILKPKFNRRGDIFIN